MKSISIQSVGAEDQMTEELIFIRESGEGGGDRERERGAAIGHKNIRGRAGWSNR